MRAGHREQLRLGAASQTEGFNLREGSAAPRGRASNPVHDREQHDGVGRRQDGGLGFVSPDRECKRHRRCPRARPPRSGTGRCRATRLPPQRNSRTGIETATRRATSTMGTAQAASASRNLEAQDQDLQADEEEQDRVQNLIDERPESRDILLCGIAHRVARGRAHRSAARRPPPRERPARPELLRDGQVPVTRASVIRTSTGKSSMAFIAR